jgi:hypothetical protein
MATPTSSPKTRLSEFFRSRLDSEELKFFNNNADADAPPPYGVVTVTELEETTPRSNAFKGTIKIAIINSIDASSSAEHDALLEKVTILLNDIPRQIIDDTAHIRLFGWTITLNEAISKEESQSFSDVITILAGCGG